MPVTPGATIYQQDFSDGGGEWATNEVWGWGSPGYPDDTDDRVRLVRGAKVNTGVGPAGENALSIDTSHGSTSYRETSCFYVTPNVTGFTTVSGLQTAQFTGWDAAQNRLTFDFRFNSTWIAAIISGALSGGNGSPCFFFSIHPEGGNGGLSCTFQFNPANGWGISGSNLMVNCTIEGYAQVLTLPMDTWLRFTCDWRCGSGTGYLHFRYALSSGGAETDIVFIDGSANVGVNSNTTLDTQEAYSGSAPTETLPAINYANYLFFGMSSVFGKLLGEYTNIHLQQISFNGEEEEEEDEEPLVGGENTVEYVSAPSMPLAAIDINDPADYYGGFKRGLVKSFGTIERAISDPIGREYETSSAQLVVADADRHIREHIREYGSRGRVINFYMYSDVARRNLSDARRMFEGIIRTDEESNDLEVSFDIEDRFGSQFSQFNLNKLVPGHIVTPQYFPNAPPEHFGRPEPLAYGRLSDEVAVSATGAPVIDIPSNIGGALEGGIYWLGGYGSMTSAAAPPTNIIVAAAASGTVAAGEYGVYVTAIDAVGRESDPTPFWMVEGIATSTPAWNVAAPTVSVSGTQKITVSWTASAGAVAYRAYLGVRYFGFRPRQMIQTASTSCEFTAATAMPGFLDSPGAASPAIDATYSSGPGYYSVTAVMPDGETVATTPEVTHLHEAHLRRTRIEWEEVSSALSYYVYKRVAAGSLTANVRFSVPASQIALNGHVWFEDDWLGSGAELVPLPPQGVVPGLYVGLFELPDGYLPGWHGFMLCRGCAAYIQSWFTAEEVWTSDTEHHTERVKQPESSEGVTFLIPGRPGWVSLFGSQLFIPIGDRRYTMVFARGPAADLAAEGKAPLTFNILGYEPIGDGTGSYIDDLPRQYLHFLVNFVVQEATGNWLTIPLNANGYSIIDGATFEVAKDYYDAILPGSLKGAWMLGVEEQEAVGDVIANLNKSLDSDCFTNANGQYAIDVASTVQSIESTILDITDVLEGSFRTWKEPEHFFTEVQYRYGKVYIEALTKPTPAEMELLPRELADKTEWLSGIVGIYNPTAIATYGENSPYDLDLYMIRDQWSADLIARRWLTAYSNPAMYAAWDMNLCGTNFELCQIHGLTHFSGLSLLGWVNKKLRLIRFRTDLDGLLTGFEARILDYTYDGEPEA